MSQQPAPTVDRAGSDGARERRLAQPAGPGYYTVKRGDTLYRIALENGQDHRDIAAWNGIANPSAIKEGQVLRVVPPGAAEPADGAVAKPIATTSGVEARSLDQPAAMPQAIRARSSASRVSARSRTRTRLMPV